MINAALQHRPLFLTLLCAFSLMGCHGQRLPGDVDTPAPPYSAAVLSRPDSIHLSQLKGSVVLLNVWATWCIPCRHEIPELVALHQQYSSRGLKVVGVSVDVAGTDQDVIDFAREFFMSYTILRDPEDRISELFRTPGVPSTFLIDRTGIVRWRHLGGFSAPDPEFMKQLTKVL